MRYIITVDGSWLSGRAAARLQENITSLLRQLWLGTATDYRAVQITSVEIEGYPGLDVPNILKRAEDLATNKQRADISKNTRFIIAETLDGTKNISHSSMELLITVSVSDSEKWGRGNKSTHADISFMKKSSLPKVEAAISDVFQDIMIANSAMLTHLREGFLNSGKSMDDFFAMKAQYAVSRVASRQNAAFYKNYTPHRYASFASLARRSVQPGVAGINLEAYADLWYAFAAECLGEWFLTPSEALDFIVDGKFRRPNPRERDIDGHPHGKKIGYKNLSKSDLKVEINSQSVRTKTRKVLLVRNRYPESPKNVDILGSKMGWTDSVAKTSRKLKLIRYEEYREYNSLIETGILTPILLFLKP